MIGKSTLLGTLLLLASPALAGEVDLCFHHGDGKPFKGQVIVLVYSSGNGQQIGGRNETVNGKLRVKIDGARLPLDDRTIHLELVFPGGPETTEIQRIEGLFGDSDRHVLNVVLVGRAKK